MINVQDFIDENGNLVQEGAPTPSKDYRNTIKLAIERAIFDGGGIVYFPGGTYYLKGDQTSGIAPISFENLENIHLYGKGAVIICDTDINTQASDPVFNGQGGGFALYGNNITVEGLRFESGYPDIVQDPLPPYYSQAQSKGRLLQFRGDYNKVKNCYFRGGNGGAIVAAGNYNSFTGNIMEKCNHNFNGFEQGAIHITANTGGSKFNTVSENKIFDQWMTGISVSGENGLLDHDISDFFISNNYIRSQSADLSINVSMGIQLMNGANVRMKVTGNIIEHVDAEGIVIVGAPEWPATQCIVANNIIRDCAFRGISLFRQDPVNYPAQFLDMTITGNIVENTSVVPYYESQIHVQTMKGGIVSNNQCIGLKDTETSEPRNIGISLTYSCYRVQVSDNQVRGANLGISFQNYHGALKDNMVYDSLRGIYLAYCLGSSVVGNMVVGNHDSANTEHQIGIQYGNKSAPLQVIGNSILDCEERFNSVSGNEIVPEVLTQVGQVNIGNPSQSTEFVSVGQLVNGNATIQFSIGSIQDGDGFFVLPVKNSSAISSGVLRISHIDPTNDRVSVESTNSKDARNFMLIRAVVGA